jgi:hypothetical protein
MKKRRRPKVNQERSSKTKRKAKAKATEISDNGCS